MTERRHACGACGLILTMTDRVPAYVGDTDRALIPMFVNVDFIGVQFPCPFCHQAGTFRPLLEEDPR